MTCQGRLGLDLSSSKSKNVDEALSMPSMASYWQFKNCPTMVFAPGTTMGKLALATPGLGSVQRRLARKLARMNANTDASRVHFPGAINSKFTTEMSFLKASDLPAIPTYRVIDSDGELVDKSRGPPDVSEEEVLKWYMNMLTGQSDRAPRKYKADHA